MDEINILTCMYKEKISAGTIKTIEELESDIVQNSNFIILDTDEKEILLDSLNDLLTENNTQSELKKNEISNENSTINKSNSISQESMRKTSYSNGYAFGSKNKSTFIPKTSSGFQFKKSAISNYVIKDPNDISEGSLLSSSEKAVIIKEINEKLYLERKNKYIQLKLIKSPVQRTQPWFAMRNKSITASDCGCTLGENKHEPVFNFIIKKVFGSTFGTNVFCYHGKKFENVVTLMYSLINDVNVEEFGLLRHPEYYFLAASPDGICSPYCRDGITPSPLVGRMIEIKCPFQRKILYTGQIKGEICPDYYWCQVQLQLECCDLDECDFVQCNIEEYNSRAEYLADTSESCDYKSKKYGLERGVLIELMPTKLNDNEYVKFETVTKTEDGDVVNVHNAITPDAIYDKASFIYQPKLDMTQKEVDQWIIDQLEKLNSKPELKLNKIIYWRFIERNCTLIVRDKKWFTNNLASMRKIWAYVEILRDNPLIAEEWKNWIDAQNKKYNEKIINKLIELIKNKGLWEKVVSAIGELDVELSEEIKNMIEQPQNYNNSQEVIKVQEAQEVIKVQEAQEAQEVIKVQEVQEVQDNSDNSISSNDEIIVENTQIKISQTNVENIVGVKKERKPRVKKSESIKKSNSTNKKKEVKPKIFKSIEIDISDEENK
jgi:putative phage-type endonuclease